MSIAEPMTELTADGILNDRAILVYAQTGQDTEPRIAIATTSMLRSVLSDIVLADEGADYVLRMFVKDGLAEDHDGAVLHYLGMDNDAFIIDAIIHNAVEPYYVTPDGFEVIVTIRPLPAIGDVVGAHTVMP